MTNGQIMAAFNQCPFNSEGGQVYCQWRTITKQSSKTREVTLERVQRSEGVSFDLREVFRTALGEGGLVEGVIGTSLEIDPRISKYITLGESESDTIRVYATLAMIRRGELEDNDLLNLPYMVQSQRPRHEGRIYIPQYDGFPTGFSVRQTNNGGGMPTFCVSINVKD